MMGLVIFGLLLGYLAIAIAGTIFAVRIAGAGPSSARQRWTAGVVVGLVFYLIPFWDWIPTVIAHKYYCATEAKFEVFKTVEQWTQENQSDLHALRYELRPMRSSEASYERFPVNQRLASDRNFEVTVFLSVKRRGGRIVDLRDHATLASWTDFGAGYAPLEAGGEGAWKFWLQADSCDQSQEGYWAKFTRMEQQIQSLGLNKK